MEIAPQFTHGLDTGIAGNDAVQRTLAGRMAVDVTVENVVKTFGDAAALHDVSLTIRRGELVALLGPSGSGKTTLLRILAGLEFPDAGSVRFGAEDALGLTVQQRHIGFVFQSYALFRTMTVFDNIAFGLSARPRRSRPSGAAIRAKVLELLDLVQLSGLEKRYPSQLSGGQRQRVALARALAIDPRLLLLDEPFGALDAKIRRDLRRWLREIHDRTGHTTVFVTHDQAEAVELADRIVVINHGRVEQVGSPDAIYDQPESPFVAGFIGESCSLPVLIDSGRVLFDGKPVAIDAIGGEGPSTLVFRPENVAITGDRSQGITGKVVADRRHGASRRCDIVVGSAGERIEIDLPPDQPVPARGEEIAFLPTRWWLFGRGLARPEAGDTLRVAEDHALRAAALARSA